MINIKPKLYISGKMTGVENYNFPAFDQEQDRLESLGYRVVNPASIDRAFGFDPMIDGDEGFAPCKHELAHILGRDLHAVACCDFIYMMFLWDESKGATMEKLFANIVNVPVLFSGYSDGQLIKVREEWEIKNNANSQKQDKEKDKQEED